MMHHPLATDPEEARYAGSIQQAKKRGKEEAEYGWKKYRCQLDGCVVELDLPEHPRNEEIFKLCEECNRRTFMRLAKV